MEIPSNRPFLPPDERSTSRRRFLGIVAGAAAARAVAPAIAAEIGPPRIARIALQIARGRRRTPVAPNAYAPYRGFDVAEPVHSAGFARNPDVRGQEVARPDVPGRHHPS